MPFVTARDGMCNIHNVSIDNKAQGSKGGQNGVDLEVSVANLSFKQGVFGKEIFILLRMLVE